MSLETNIQSKNTEKGDTNPHWVGGDGLRGVDGQI